MFPMKGMNQKQMQKMMRQMGVKVEEIDGVTKVVIFSQAGDIVITNPQVTKTKIMGQIMYQVVGEERVEKPAESEATLPAEGPTITDEDVELVATQAGTTKERAKRALEETNGDIAEAIISLSQ
jgi:nascent polypeptide-associated complex subunit alpha